MIYNLAKNVVTVNNVNALRNSSLSNTDLVILEGYYSKNDGGEGQLYIDKTDTTSADNNGTIFVTVNGLRVKRVITSYLSISWFGVKNNLTNTETALITTNTQQLQNCINVAINTNKSIFIPYGRFLFNDTLTIGAIGLLIYGCKASNSDSEASNLEWCGSTGKAAIVLESCHRCKLSDFNVRFQTNVDCLIRLTRNPNVTTRISSQNTLENLSLGNSSSNKTQYCIEITANAAKNSSDGNNDLHRFINVSGVGYSEAFCRTELASQAHELLFIGCCPYGSLTGKYVLLMDGGFFSWIGGSGGGSSVCDFYINAIGAPMSINKWNSEHSAALIHTAGQTSASQSMTVSGVRFDGYNKNADYFIRWTNPGALVIDNCYFSFLTENKHPKIYLYSASTARCNVLQHTNNTYAEDEPSSVNHIEAIGNWRINSLGNINQYPEPVECDNFINGIANLSVDSVLGINGNFNNLSAIAKKLSTVPNNAIESDGVNLYYSRFNERFIIPLTKLDTSVDTNVLSTTNQTVRFSAFTGLSIDSNVSVSKVNSWTSQQGSTTLTTFESDWKPYLTYTANGKPCLRFDGSTAVFGVANCLYTNIVPFTLSSFTIYLVLYSYTNTVTNSSTIFSLGEPSDGIKAFFNNTDLEVTIPGQQTAVVSNGKPQGLHCYAITFNSAGLTNTDVKSSNIYIDGELKLNYDFTNSTLTTPVASFTIGADSGYRFNPFLGYYCELICYNTIHDTTTIEANTNLLLSKWL